MYFIMYIDEFLKYTYIYLIKIKDEVLYKFKIFNVEVENFLHCNIKI